MHRLSCIVSVVAALFLLPACGSFSEENQPPITAPELDRFLADTPTVIASIQKAALRCRDLTGDAGNRVLRKARNEAVRELGWARGRFSHILACARDVLSREYLEASMDELEAKAKNALPQADRDAIRAELQKMETILETILRRLQARTTMAERVFFDERLDALRQGCRNDMIIQPYSQQ